MTSTRTMLWNLNESAPSARQDAHWDLYIQLDSAHTLDAFNLDGIEMADTRNRRTVYDGVAKALDCLLTVAAEDEAPAVLVVVGIEINVFTLQWSRARLDALWRTQAGHGRVHMAAPKGEVLTPQYPWHKDLHRRQGQ